MQTLQLFCTRVGINSSFSFFYHGEAGFLRDYLDGTHPLAVGDRINDFTLQKLGYLLLHYIKNHRVESSLWLSYWFSSIL